MVLYSLPAYSGVNKRKKRLLWTEFKLCSLLYYNTTLKRILNELYKCIYNMRNDSGH